MASTFSVVRIDEELAKWEVVDLVHDIACAGRTLELLGTTLILKSVRSRSPCPMRNCRSMMRRKLA